MTRATDIVITTIFEPAWLQGYLENIRAHGHADHVMLRIICDRKTPASVYAAASDARRAGFRIDCPTLDEQESYLKKVGLPDDFIPWNSDNRRNVGFMRAWEAGAEVMISIDDDNYCRSDSDFIGAHNVVGAPLASLHDTRYVSGAPWFNICSLLSMNVDVPIFPRGFPYAARTRSGTPAMGPVPAGAEQRVIAFNAGLWLDDPDVDAISRLAIGPRALSADPRPVVLAPETWSPINTQNTSLIRDAIPTYYYVRMGFPLRGMRIDRFGDIVSGYFAQKCAKHLGHDVRIGDPVADHRRTPHNLMKDLYQELAGVMLIEDLLPWLQDLVLDGGNYGDAYAALADALEAQASRFKGFVWDEGGCEFLTETAGCMRQWLAALRRLG